MPAAVQRNAIAAFSHRFTLRQTRRTVPIMFSIELVQASERLSFAGKPRRLPVSIFVEPFEDASGDTGRLLVKPTGEIAQQPLGFIGIVELPSLPEGPAYRRMQRRGQPLDHVAGFMNLAALEGCVGTEGATDDFAQRFGAIDDEQPADLGIKTALDQVVDSA
jgi:hypothetical protein